ncbi:MAG: tRNA (adenosine(37)-N6)-threonylcarbamoyltransferase complex dimerization subunit type 1 TsaB [Flavobacteriales bacterium]|nr:tRNA (adenosine(37)-N6)-threonylcarbamoyltransferase complex dimerization subunit type 1 TsaB [Flavobacteriales bacterium]
MTAQPLILALETSTLSCSVALFRGEQLLGARQISEAQHVHGKELLPLIDEVLRANEITSPELQGIAVSAGPGSYTGLRIGVSTAKGIAHAHNLPLMAFDSLHVQACAAASEQSWTAIIAVMDARRDEVYTSSFVPTQTDSLWLTPPEHSSLSQPPRQGSYFLCSKILTDSILFV